MQNESPLSIIIPAYNESRSLEELIRSLASVMEREHLLYECIIVDDGSSDETAQVLEALQQQYSEINVIRHPRNLGKSFALASGFERANGEVAVTIDADLQDIPEMIPLLLKRLDEGADLVVGWRRERRDHRIKRLVSALFRFATRILFHCRLHDINCGMKAYRRAVYRDLRLWGGLHRVTPLLAARRGFHVAEIPIEHAERKYGASRYPLLRIQGGIDLIALLFSDVISAGPAKSYRRAAGFFTGLAALAFIAGFSGWSLLDGGWRFLAAGICALPALAAFGLAVISLRQGKQLQEIVDAFGH